MFQEEREFRLRFSLEASFPEDYEGEEDNYAWLRDWDQRIKPELVKLIFETLRRHPSWTARVRNRGVAPADEVEIVLTKDVLGTLPKLN